MPVPAKPRCRHPAKMPVRRDCFRLKRIRQEKISSHYISPTLIALYPFPSLCLTPNLFPVCKVAEARGSTPFRHDLVAAVSRMQFPGRSRADRLKKTS